MYSQQHYNHSYMENMYQHQHHHVMQQQQQRKEPLPSATDGKPNVVLSITEIAEFSSTMVYLMWHARRQSVMDLHSSSKIENNYVIKQSLEQTRVTADMANMTSAAFKKFCRQILTATQLSESVVLLSLKYIAMLLSNNPNIHGADGSEYRLFTVALMLANKFLDDNTFTNKTWSEVSGMKVVDLNIMELEFLDVLNFKLSIQKGEYERWRIGLFNFRNQLMGVPVEIQRQKLMETMALSVFQQQVQKVQPLYLFSKAQQQQIPPIPAMQFNGPLTRVQLRIPSHPIYHSNKQLPYSTTTTKTVPIYPIQQQQCQQQIRANHRTSSLPQSGVLSVKNPTNTTTTSYYYTSSSSSSYNNNNNNNPYHHNTNNIPRSTSYNTTTMEDPLTAAESYKTRHHY